MLAGVAVAAANGKKLPTAVAKLCTGIKASDEQKAVAESLAAADKALVLTGNIAGRHQAWSAVRALAAAICDLTGATLGYVSEGPNTAGADLAGVVPHRAQGGKKRKKPGLNAADMLNASLDAVLLHNFEPDADFLATDDAVAKLARQKFVVALTPYDSAAIREAADLLLPIGTFAETSGTYVNVAGLWQSFAGVASPVGEARPAWKVLRVLGNLVEADGFDYVTSEDVLAELKAAGGRHCNGQPLQERQSAR